MLESELVTFERSKAFELYLYIVPSMSDNERLWKFFFSNLAAGDPPKDTTTREKLVADLKDLGKIYDTAANFDITTLKTRFLAVIDKIVYALEKFSEQELGVMNAALDLSYSDPTDVAGHFIKTVGNNASVWDSSIYYAPCLSLVQSSGTGKTRLLKEVAEKGVYVVYVNLRSKRESGVPSHIGFSDTFIGWESQSRYARFLFVMLQKIESSQLSPIEFYNLCKNDTGGFWTTVEKSMEESKPAEAELPAKCFEVVNRIQLPQKGNTSSQNTPPKLKVLFAFDEARHLLTENKFDANTGNTESDDSSATKKTTSFKELRRAFRKLQNKIPIFAVLTDTFSKVSYLSPANHRDPSYRVSERGNQIYKPYFLCTMDLANPLNPKSVVPANWTYVDMYSDSKAPVLFENKAKLSDIGTLKHLCRYGRPLWITTYLPATIETPGDKAAVEKLLLSLARCKMIGGLKFTLWPENNAEDISLNIFALLSCVYDIAAHLLPQSVETMIASYMCVLGYVSEDRQVVYGKYASEPVLVEGAMHCLWKFGVVDALNQYHQYLSLLSAGETGEFISRFILLFSFQYLLNTKQANSMFYFSQRKTLKEFIRSLFVEQEAKDLIDILQPELKEGLVCFSHFRRVNYVPDENHLREAFCRSMAIISEDNATGVDLVIPVCLAEIDPLTKKAKDSSDMSVKDLKMSAFLIQVKNRYSAFSLNKTKAKLAAGKVDVKLPAKVRYLTMIMSLWNVHGTAFSVNSKGRQTHVIVEGLDKYKIFTEETKLKTLNEKKESVPLNDGHLLLKTVCKRIANHKHSLGQRSEKDLLRLHVQNMYPLEYQFEEFPVEVNAEEEMQ
jgi:hypothetical protein